MKSSRESRGCSTPSESRSIPAGSSPAVSSVRGLLLYARRGHPDQSRLRGQLEEAHWASGFRPREIPGLHNDLVDPAEMMVRAFHLWRQTRWPGRNGRAPLRAHSVQPVRHTAPCAVEHARCGTPIQRRRGAALAGSRRARPTLENRTADQPVLVRDARWLIPLAQSPTTDELGAYFEVAETVAETLSHDDRIEIHTAGVRMAGGHLRSQLRHYSLTERRVCR